MLSLCLFSALAFAYPLPTVAPTPSFHRQILAYNPSGYWRLNQVTGTALDWSTAANNATVQIAPTFWQPGLMPLDYTSAACKFTTTPYFSAADTSALRLTGANWSIVLLVNSTSSNTFEGWISKWDNTTPSNGWMVGTTLTTPNNVRFEVRTGGSPYAFAGTKSMSDGNTHLVVVTGTVISLVTTTTIYVDGAVDASAVLGLIGAQTQGTVNIGNRSQLNDLPATNTMEEIAVIPSTLTGTQVADLYQKSTRIL